MDKRIIAALVLLSCGFAAVWRMLCKKHRVVVQKNSAAGYG
jgi:hypothetical protein